MPAPVPVVIQHGNPKDIGLLAAAAGSAQYANQQSNQDYNRYLTQLSIDSNMVNAEMNRRVADNQLNNQLMAQQITQQNQRNAFNMQDAYAQSKARLIGSPTNPVGGAASAMPAAPSPSLYGSAPTPTSDGAGGGYVIQHQAPPGQARQNTQMGPDGQIVSSVPRTGGFVRGTPPTPPIDAGKQAQLNYLESIRSLLPVDQYNAALVAANSGQLKMDQFIDNVRQAIPDTGAKSLSAKSSERRQQDMTELQAVLDTNDPFVAQTFADTRYGFSTTHPFSTPEQAQAFVRNQLSALAAIDTAAGSASQQVGEIPTLSPEQARLQPRGTRFRGTDGVVRTVQ